MSERGIERFRAVEAPVKEKPAGQPAGVVGGKAPSPRSGGKPGSADHQLG